MDKKLKLELTKQEAEELKKDLEIYGQMRTMFLFGSTGVLFKKLKDFTKK